jgi:hypothetical protein
MTNELLVFFFFVVFVLMTTFEFKQPGTYHFGFIVSLISLLVIGLSLMYPVQTEEWTLKALDFTFGLIPVRELIDEYRGIFFVGALVLMLASTFWNRN